MIRLSKSVLAVGGVVLAAGLITFTNPKAVHAVTAALVQVTNTASNPAVTQSVGAQAGNMVHLNCSVTLSGTNIACFQFAADGSESTSGGYTVPTGESLVITAIDVQPNNQNVCPGSYALNLGTTSKPGVFLTVTTTNAPLTTHFTYPSGLVIGEGISPTWFGYSENGSVDQTCGGFESVDIFGYLTTA
jgi:hypothetical protein